MTGRSELARQFPNDQGTQIDQFESYLVKPWAACVTSDKTRHPPPFSRRRGLRFLQELRPVFPRKRRLQNRRTIIDDRFTDCHNKPQTHGRRSAVAASRSCICGVSLGRLAWDSTSLVDPVFRSFDQLRRNGPSVPVFALTRMRVRLGWYSVGEDAAFRRQFQRIKRSRSFSRRASVF